MCKDAAEKLVFVIWYVPNRCKSQEICDTAILKDGGTLLII